MKKFLLSFLVLVILLVGFKFWSGQNTPQPTPTVIPSPAADVQIKNSFEYIGESGRDALVLLKEKTSVEQDASGLVVSINGRKADSAKHEFWAFYVNGEMAQVGPADYKTKSTDKIEWKIETY